MAWCASASTRCRRPPGDVSSHEDQTSDSGGRKGRRWPFRTWEVIVIAIAIVLYLAAAFAAPQGTPPASAPPTPTPGSSGTPGLVGPTGAEATATPDIAIPHDGQGRTGDPVAVVDQVLDDVVGGYYLANRSLSEAGANGGALQSAELRYTLRPQRNETDVFHGVEVHLDSQAARDRVRDFGDSLASTGFKIQQQRNLRSDAGGVQGLFLELVKGEQRLMLWSNRNVMFSLGGGAQADLDTFYEDLPY
jgi:hypothetical protein